MHHPPPLLTIALLSVYVVASFVFLINNAARLPFCVEKRNRPSVMGRPSSWRAGSRPAGSAQYRIESRRTGQRLGRARIKGSDPRRILAEVVAHSCRRQGREGERRGRVQAFQREPEAVHQGQVFLVGGFMPLDSDSESDSESLSLSLSLSESDGIHKTGIGVAAPVPKQRRNTSCMGNPKFRAISIKNCRSCCITVSSRSVQRPFGILIVRCFICWSC